MARQHWLAVLPGRSEPGRAGALGAIILILPEAAAGRSEGPAFSGPCVSVFFPAYPRSFSLA